MYLVLLIDILPTDKSGGFTAEMIKNAGLQVWFLDLFYMKILPLLW